ncbi:hypothetical protein LOY38_13615 [Pseudomonas sp. B21-015]|uniref:hypothetical protein n=1 Tax=Pseudomonas sp. B21-015 TaxID=2895473 RepID=UPI00215EB0E3|nr:hypothetical protein [Pseudomonas sp. B21-015]UVM52985.1 hypothetical protein LOY38_13615 [Pseudomonas sp. B21-015]
MTSASTSTLSTLLLRTEVQKCRSAEVQKCRSRPRKPPQSAILFGSTPSGISQEDSESLFWALQVLFLYHELMHAKNLKIEKNFSLPDRRVDLVKAEIYTDISTLRFLSSIRSPKRMYSEYLYAAGILGRAKTPIYTRIFNGITKSFPEAQLKAWASNSTLPFKTQLQERKTNASY